MKSESLIQMKINKLERSKQVYLNYAKDRYDWGDWHGMQDAGSDLREIEVQIQALQWVLNDAEF